MYLQMDAVRALTATAIVRILAANRWYHVSIISEDTYADDGFVQAFYRLTNTTSGGGGSSGTSSDWSIEDHIRVSRRSTRDEVDRQLLALLENQSRVIVLHSRSASRRHAPTDMARTPSRAVTRSTAIAEGPRDASSQLKSCQLPRNSAETTCTTSPEPSSSCG